MARSDKEVARHQMIQRVPAAVRGFVATLTLFGLISWQSAPVSFAPPKWFGWTLDWSNGSAVSLLSLQEHSVKQLRVMLAYSPYRYGNATSAEAALVGYVDAFRDYTRGHLQEEFKACLDRSGLGAGTERDRVYVCTGLLLGEAVTRPLTPRIKEEAWDAVHRWAMNPSPGRALSQVMLASVLLRNQFNVEARKVMAGCCAANPKLAAAFHVWAFACETGEAALPTLAGRQGVVDPDDPGFEFLTAIRARRRIVELNPADDDNRLRLAKDLTTVGQQDEARAIYESLAAHARDPLTRKIAQTKLG